MIVAIYVLVGTEPYDVKIGIVNNGEVCIKKDLLNPKSCSFQLLSCRFIELINEEQFNKVNFFSTKVL